MKERLLQLIWQFGIFNKQDLRTTHGDSILVMHPGVHNDGQGPDFLNARLIIGQACWIGSIELHVMASSWIRHGHTGDPHYRNVILHVVWEEDKKLSIPVPVLELKGLVSSILLARFRQMMMNKNNLPCSHQFSRLPILNLQAWRDRLALERLEARKNTMLLEWTFKGISWQEVLWRQLLASFGMPRNQEAFRSRAIALPYSLINRLREDTFQLEALLMGQSGMLGKEYSDDYSGRLMKEYQFLSKKFGLTPNSVLIHSYGCRPASSPAVRLSQIADFLHRQSHIINWALKFENIVFIKESLQLRASSYWRSHVAPGVSACAVPIKTGPHFQNHIIINTLIPFLYCYADHYGDNLMKEKLLNLMEQLPPEKNNITDIFNKMGMKNRSSSDSQALIQLYKEYCLRKKCLQCTIGLGILKGS
jgi:hypothetical protein